MKGIVLSLVSLFVVLALSTDAEAQLLRRRRGGGNMGSQGCNMNLCSTPASACAGGACNVEGTVPQAAPAPVTPGLSFNAIGEEYFVDASHQKLSEKTSKKIAKTSKKSRKTSSMFSFDVPQDTAKVPDEIIASTR